MMEMNGLVNALNASVKELQDRLDSHCCLVASIIEKRMDQRNLKPFLDLNPSRAREAALKNAIREAIDVLEASRKAFKSKQLEVLRKNLIQVLIDIN